MATHDAPRIWIGALRAYNNGKLHGEWFDMDGWTEDDFWEATKQVLESSPVTGDEEWFIADNEGWGSYKLGEHPGVKEMIALANAIEEHGEIITTVMDHLGMDVQDAIDYHEEHYQGEYSSDEDFAREFVAGIGGMKETFGDSLSIYFDADSYARDLGYDGWHEGDESDEDSEGNPEEEGWVYDPSGEKYVEGSLEDAANHFLDEGMISDEQLENYVDWDKVALDLMMDYFEEDGHYWRSA